ncbi:DUF2161 domain-containing phosphodiesterase [Aquibacillus salsiterrae]|uniref:DUF2161 family putative PD-(D/E)XK-type phosphodiesterase n=1 Tax=Aquibacillus salsiterrae TaxID=2950439 RepID=A0A9X4AGU7_9BACI|nr:DUF2161 family putative PD-(D/E)XK-type phosphodiesterase [Aquibacillus salsiterrae]MDC3417640.1 DUF2161 family putative PD-(D/E)XK-type phosphodiesterase [Aquibacillus salsiterrae]
MEQAKLKEADLYEPIQKYFKRKGYDVYGEVKDCDVAVIKDDLLIIVELKLNLSVDLLIQATKRQRLSEHVYIAIPKPKKFKPRSKKWRDICHLVQRLELGLILVSFLGERKRVEIILEPTPFQRPVSRGKAKYLRQAIIKEIDGRSADYNTGGSNRQQIMTAYRENCVQIACYLEQHGELSPKQLIRMGTGKKTQSILNKNYYGWFVRVKRGIYVLSDKGKLEMNAYPELLEYYRKTETRE